MFSSVYIWKVLVVANGLKLLQVSIPPLKLTGQNARLACLYDLEGDALYSIKWYTVHNNSYLNSLDFIDLTPRPLYDVYAVRFIPHNNFTSFSPSLYIWYNLIMRGHICHQLSSHILAYKSGRAPNSIIQTIAMKFECVYYTQSRVLYWSSLSMKFICRYKGGREFFRYVQRDQPPMQVFPVDGVTVDVSLLIIIFKKNNNGWKILPPDGWMIMWSDSSVWEILCRTQ